MNSKTVAFLLLGIMCLIPATAQDVSSDSNDEKTVEEYYLESSPEAKIAKGLAESNDLNGKMEALEILETMYADGELSESSFFELSILENLALESITIIKTRGGREINDYPFVRSRSCKLLGQIGGQLAMNTLLKVIRYETRALVRGEAVLAIAQLDIPPDDFAMNVITYSVITQSSITPDNRYAHTVILALEQIAEKHDGLVRFDLVVDALMTVITGSYINSVKTEASDLLIGMRRYTD